MDAVAENRMNERIDEQARDVAKLWGAHRELAVVVHGARGDNGLRSKVRALEDWRERKDAADTALSSRLQHYVDVERAKTCHGKAAVAEHIEDHEKREAEDVKLKEANISARAVILAATIPSSIAAMASIIAALVVAGVIG